MMSLTVCIPSSQQFDTFVALTLTWDISTNSVKSVGLHVASCHWQKGIAHDRSDSPRLFQQSPSQLSRLWLAHVMGSTKDRLGNLLRRSLASSLLVSGLEIVVRDSHRRYSLLVCLVMRATLFALDFGTCEWEMLGYQSQFTGQMCKIPFNLAVHSVYQQLNKSVFPLKWRNTKPIVQWLNLWNASYRYINLIKPWHLRRNRDIGRFRTTSETSLYSVRYT